MGKHVAPALAIGQASKGSDIVGERKRRQRTLPNHDWMDKLHGNVLSVCTTSTIAKSDQFPALLKPLRHVVAGPGNSFSPVHQGQAGRPSALQCVSRDAPQRRYLLGFARTVHESDLPV